MLTHHAGTTWIAWIGLEVVELRDLALDLGSGAVAPDELASAIETHTADILAGLATIGDLALEVRYRHDPGRQRPRVALLARIRHPDQRSAMARADAAANRLGRFKPVELQLIQPDELRTGWLTALPRRPDWAVAAHRRITYSPAGNLWAAERLVATPDQWHGVLAALWESPDPAILAVRLEPVTGANHQADLHQLAGQLRLAASHRYDRAAGQLGMAVTIPPDPFAVGAQAAVDELIRLHGPVSFRFRIELAGMGAAPDRLIDRLTSLCRSRHPIGDASQPALDVRTVDPSSLSDLDQDQQNLTILHVDRRPDRPGGGPQPMASRRLDLVEAAGLFFVPRAQPRPTPGLPSALDALRSTGIPPTPYAFISYDRRDTPWVQGLARALRRWQLPYWWDGNLVGGDYIGDRIAAALRHPNCTVVLAIVGPIDNQRDWVASELATAASLGRRTVTVRVNRAPLPADNRLCVDLSLWNPDDQNDPALIDLLQNLGRYLTGVQGW